MPPESPPGSEIVLRLRCSTYPAKSRIYPRAPEAKVFWFFASEKNILPESFDFQNFRPEWDRDTSPALSLCRARQPI
jgi:hypothetical protein